jgi:hypothetical protein
MKEPERDHPMSGEARRWAARTRDDGGSGGRTRGRVGEAEEIPPSQKVQAPRSTVGVWRDSRKRGVSQSKVGEGKGVYLSLTRHALRLSVRVHFRQFERVLLYEEGSVVR